MEISRVGIVGSGIMGSGLCEVAAKAGFEVVVRSRAQRSADAVIGGLETSLQHQVDRSRIDSDTRDRVLARVEAVTDLDALSTCDLVVESVVEDLTTKQALFRDLSTRCPEETLLATNTSTLAVIEMAMQTRRPDRVCGIHFFNPAPIMNLVEIVRTVVTSDETVRAARDFVEQCGKRTVEVKDRSGFLVNSLLFPYLNNAVKALDSGLATRDDIDAAMCGACNFPMGPLQLLDLVGLDTSLAILEALHDEYADPNFAPAPMLRRLVAAEHLGRKSGQGFYTYSS